MRVIVYGVGAIGGTLAVALARSGTEVIGIARGAQLEAIRENGLLLRTPEGDFRERFECVGDPDEIAFRPDDVILLTMKTQDTVPALERLRSAGVREQAIVCTQNGIANEDFALRLFENVYGVVISIPATYVKPGEVADFFAPKIGLMDIGRYGAGADIVSEKLAERVRAAGLACFVHEDVMAHKYAKLVQNLGNAVGVVMREGAAQERYLAAARAEAAAVFEAAGIVPAQPDRAERAALASMHDIEGAERVGSSSVQSLARGAGSIETDYLNGEIVLMGRRLGVPTPVNAYFAARAHQMLREGTAPGSVPVEEIEAALPGV